MTDTELNEIEARAEAATPGEWTVETCGGGCCISSVGPIVPSVDPYLECTVADAAFVAAARQDVPALIAEVRRLNKMVNWLATHNGECCPSEHLRFVDCGEVREGENYPCMRCRIEAARRDVGEGI